MSIGTRPHPARAIPSLPAPLELLKPVTWFAATWAFAFGVVSSGKRLPERWEMATAFALSGV